MRKWRWGHGRGADEHPPPAAPSPPEVSEVVLPDPDEAREALAETRKMKKRNEDLSRDVRAWLDYLRNAREENEFAKGIVEMIREGR